MSQTLTVSPTSILILGEQVLIIDEISMVSGEFFNELEVMARRLMGSTDPFGGIQLILSGDYYQCASWSLP